MSPSDKTRFAPFTLITGEFESLILSDEDMLSRVGVFEERADDGWSGNGYDWTSVARVVVDEKLPDLKDQLDFDPEAGMFSASGPLEALERLGAEMKKVFEDEGLLRDFLRRAELD